MLTPYLLLFCPPDTLHRAIARHVHIAAYKIADFREGTITTSFIAECPEAELWLRESASFTGHTSNKANFCSPLIPGHFKPRSPQHPSDQTSIPDTAVHFQLLPFSSIAIPPFSDDPWLSIQVNVLGATAAANSWCAYHAYNALCEYAGRENLSRIICPQAYNPDNIATSGDITFKPEFTPSP